MHEHETDKQLRDRLSQAAMRVAVGARYKHYKGNNYKVLLLALRETDNEPCVIYQAEYGSGVIFIRPVVNWLEQVEVNGALRPRFTKL